MHPGAIAPGQLLIATEPGRGGYFDRSVVLLLEHTSEGTIGVCLHRPTELPATQLLPAFEVSFSAPEVAFDGGPVHTDSVIALAELATPGAPPPGWQRICGEIGVAEASFPAELVGSSFSRVRVFVGLAGWSPGQLEGELIRGAWFRTQARPGEIFGQPTSLWRQVLRRMGGASGRWSTWTAAPQWN